MVAKIFRNIYLYPSS